MKTLILGLGNPLLSDDAAGIQVARLLQSRVTRPDVTVMEGGVNGLDFLEVLPGYDRVIAVDAVQTGTGKAGQLHRFKPDDIAARRASTPHDIDFATAIELGKRLGVALPPEITIFGIEADDVTSLSEECTPAVKAAIPACVNLIIQELDHSPSLLIKEM
jgi:hydrogenase maturation protease